MLTSVLDDERHPSVQIYAAVGGTVAVDIEVSNGRVDGTAARRRLFPLLSSAKPILAATALVACRDAGLPYDHPLAATIPELTGQGRDGIRLRDVLTHQTGFPPMPTRPEYARASWDDAFRSAIEVSGDGPVEPGGAACYQEWRYWFLLGEFITRVTGRPVPDVVRSAVLAPLGLDREIVPGRAAPRDPQRGWRGGVTTFGSVRAVAAFLAALPGGPDFQPDGVFHDLPEIAAPWRVGLVDTHFVGIRDWGLGVMLESVRWGRRSLVFSRYASARTYGHVARKGIVAFVDPVHGLAGAVLGSGNLDGIETRYFLRSACTAIYQELGLAH
jgi:CubicO group peptidase (beta-lactamase class C family)